jgi:hypothetical protein
MGETLARAAAALWVLSCGLSCVVLAGVPLQTRAQTAATTATERPAAAGLGLPTADEPNLLLELRLGDAVLSDSLNAWQTGGQLLLPLGELARLLSLAITVDSGRGSASGFLLSEDRSFGLNVPGRLISVAGRSESLEAHQVKVFGEDIYLASTLLSRWWPLDFELELTSLRLLVKPRERLPLQARLDRERAAARAGGGPQTPADPGYPRRLVPHAWLGRPFIDQTLSLASSSDAGRRQGVNYTAYLTADVLGMEGSAYVTRSGASARTDHRLTLARTDPEGTLLGPLKARSLLMGDFTMPSVAHVMGGGSPAPGLSVSNRPLDLPVTFDRQSLRGDLPPGWDVTLYYNDALLGYQQSRGDGRYAFDDLPLSYGRNDFLLVFNGPQGQLRTERSSFSLDQAIIQPGQWFYTVAHQAPGDTGSRSLARVDWGLPGGLVASGAWMSTPRLPSGTGASEERSHSQIGLRMYRDAMILTSEITQGSRAGMLGEIGLKTSLGPGLSLDLLHLHRRGLFDSEAYPLTGDPLQHRTKVRLLGVAGSSVGWRLPVAAEYQRDVLRSGDHRESASARLSTSAWGAMHTASLAWQQVGARNSTPGILNGALQSSSRLLDMGISSQMFYSLRPKASLDGVVLTADRVVNEGQRINAGLLRDLRNSSTLWTMGVSRRFGSFALALNGSVDQARQWTVGLQLFTALGHDPRSDRWFAESLPLAGQGGVVARAFVDRNLNGLRDPGEEAVANAAFILNSGGRHPVRTDNEGSVLISRLPAGRYSDLALDPGTLEDPLWKPLTAGVRVLPRPGLVQMLDFPVAATADIDGTVYLWEGPTRRAVGDAVIELVDARQQVVQRVRSASDGFFTMPQVLPGDYRLRVSAEQVSKLRLQDNAERTVRIGPDSDFVNGQDLELRRLPP